MLTWYPSGPAALDWPSLTFLSEASAGSLVSWERLAVWLWAPCWSSSAAHIGWCSPWAAALREAEVQRGAGQPGHVAVKASPFAQAGCLLVSRARGAWLQASFWLPLSIVSIVAVTKYLTNEA